MKSYELLLLSQLFLFMLMLSGHEKHKRKKEEKEKLQVVNNYEISEIPYL